MRKLLEDLTPNRPFGYETGFSVSLQDHTARKSGALLEAKASAAIADAAAFIFIDAIDPIGTVNPLTSKRHQRMSWSHWIPGGTTGCGWAFKPCFTETVHGKASVFH